MKVIRCVEAVRNRSSIIISPRFLCHISFLLLGFRGHNCEENVDDCPGHKCMNGGICVDGVNTYNCQCPPEWTGKYTPFACLVLIFKRK